MNGHITNLRSALELLATAPGQFVRRTAPVNPYCELAAVYRQTCTGQAMLFEKVAGFAMPVVTGVMATRARMALLLGGAIERLPFHLLNATEHPLAPETVRSAVCQEVVVRPPIDLRKLLPVPTLTPDDAGPFITAGLVRAQDPETGAANVSIHRLCLHGEDTLSIYFVPGRHIDQFRAKAEQAGRALPVSVSIGLDPAVYLAACTAAPQGFDELAVAGAIRGRAVELVDCVSVRAQAPARAEIVIEGEILPWRPRA